MGRYSIDEFIARNSPPLRGDGPFELESERMLSIRLNGRVWIKSGATVAHTGQIQFTREGVGDRGLVQLLPRAVAGAGARLTRAEGAGQLRLADQAKKISILLLHNDTLDVNGHDVLALEPGVAWNVQLLRQIAGLWTGGWLAVRLRGTGRVAVTTHFDPITLRAAPRSIDELLCARGSISR